MAGGAGFLGGEDADFAGSDGGGEGVGPTAAGVFNEVAGAYEGEMAADGGGGARAGLVEEVVEGVLGGGGHAEDDDAVGEAAEADVGGEGAEGFLAFSRAVAGLAGEEHFGEFAAVEGEFALADLLEFAHDFEALPGVAEVAGEDLHHVAHFGDLGEGDDGDAVVGLFEAGEVDVIHAGHGFADLGEGFGSGRGGEDLAGEEGAEVAALAGDGDGDVGEADMAGVDLGAAGGATTLLGGAVAAAAGLLLVGAEAVDEVAEEGAGAGRGAAGGFLTEGVELGDLDECFAGGDAGALLAGAEEV